ncbi:hypothetical protein ACJ73_08687 [Blastomyces percursus]|uniref:F-box domain-containing protein n=1 Tax=Blastomyces percursus TaxID=1658174 RepID=A0A1J9QF57_9EURO|nr:hypothetical protein ACJ73_08687 [Blastomyces percursus]
MAGWTDLANELLYAIFDYLPNSDIKNVRLTYGILTCYGQLQTILFSASRSPRLFGMIDGSTSMKDIEIAQNCDTGTDNVQLSFEHLALSSSRTRMSKPSGLPSRRSRVFIVLASPIIVQAHALNCLVIRSGDRCDEVGHTLRGYHAAVREISTSSRVISEFVMEPTCGGIDIFDPSHIFNAPKEDLMLLIMKNNLTTLEYTLDGYIRRRADSDCNAIHKQILRMTFACATALEHFTLNMDVRPFHCPIRHNPMSLLDILPLGAMGSLALIVISLLRRQVGRFHSHSFRFALHN